MKEDITLIRKKKLSTRELLMRKSPEKFRKMIHDSKTLVEQKVERFMETVDRNKNYTASRSYQSLPSYRYSSFADNYSSGNMYSLILSELENVGSRTTSHTYGYINSLFRSIQPNVDTVRTSYRTTSRTLDSRDNLVDIKSRYQWIGLLDLFDIPTANYRNTSIFQSSYKSKLSWMFHVWRVGLMAL